MGSKASDYGLSELEYKIICKQIKRRKALRAEFLKARTDPCLHSKEAGYVFDPAIQKFLSMKVSQLDYFKFNFHSIKFAICTIVIPMSTLGYVLWNHRNNRERQIRSGQIKYRQRLFKFC